MPYVPGCILSGPADLALFHIAAGTAKGDPVLAPDDQIQATVEQLLRVLQSLEADFSDVVVLWNRCMMLDEIEVSVLTTRATLGLRRALAESVLDVDAALDRNPMGADGRPVALEYIVPAQVPR